MRAGKNGELDYLLINLTQQPNPNPTWQAALRHRDKTALRKLGWSWMGTLEYGRFGPGVKLYFTLLKYLVGLLVVVSVAVAPTLLANFKGGGLSIYGSSWGQSVMRFSLGNQPSVEFEAEVTLEEEILRAEDSRWNQLIVVSNDVLCSCIFLAFLIFWQLKTEDLVAEMVKEDALPSYHTLIVDLPPNPLTQTEIMQHFNRFGPVRQVELVYDYASFLIEVKEFMRLVDRYGQELDAAKKELLYDRIQRNYLKIKDQFRVETQGNLSALHLPFRPLRAFVSFEDPELCKRVHGLYKYRIERMGLALGGRVPKVQKCHVEPLSVLWENFHLRDNSEYLRSCLFGLLVGLILLLTLCAIFLLSLHSSEAMEGGHEEGELLSYAEVVASGDRHKIFAFCAALNYKTFQWKYYSLCEEYFASFEHRWAFVLTLSAAVTIITLILIKVVFTLAQLRRFRTLPEKRRFLIISIFLSYLVSSSLLALLIRAEVVINGESYSLVGIGRALLPNAGLGPHIELYSQMNRKWYMHIGKLLMVNYLLTLNVCPWLYIGEEWILQWGREVWAKRAKTQKVMNHRILDREFYWEFYYAVTLNSLYFCLLFSVALPLLYPLALLSLLSLFLSSKLIFHRYTRMPQVYDHKLNAFIMRAVAVALLLHQLTSYLFLTVEQIFPQKDLTFFSPNALKVIYSLVAGLVAVGTLNARKIGGYIRKKVAKREELMMTEEINSTFGAEQPKGKKRGTSSYLNSYKMQDNPYYNPISYTLMILHRAILDHQEAEQVEEVQIMRREVVVEKALSEDGGRSEREMDFVESDRNMSI